MPINLEKANANKEAILSTLSARGPSLPVHLAQAIQLSPLFASAFLSELYAEGKLKISGMKVGASPLYYLPGQEALLENFLEQLNAREKEAVLLLKKEKILDDELQTPVTRVALRATKDFAVPLKITLNDKEKLYWKYFLISDSEIKSILEPPKKHEKQAQIPAEHQLKKHETKQPEPDEHKIIDESKLTKEPSEQKENKPIEPPLKKLKKSKKAIESKFINNLREYLAAKEIEILEAIEEKKKEFYAKIRIDSLFGKQEYYLVSKDKKKLSENDLVYALQKAQEMKMPALIMAPGELDKKANEYHKSWKNMLKFEKIKL